MTIEVHNVEGFTGISGLSDDLTQALERRRAQHCQLDLAANRVQPFKQWAGHNLIGHVRGADRTGDHHQRAFRGCMAVMSQCDHVDVWCYGLSGGLVVLA
jgi:hypothetical protein